MTDLLHIDYNAATLKGRAAATWDLNTEFGQLERLGNAFSLLRNMEHIDRIRIYKDAAQRRNGISHVKVKFGQKIP